MKLICFILAFYTLGLSMLPCNDVHNGQKQPIVSSIQAQDHHDQDNDICSPFCTCACCQSIVTITSPVTIQFVYIPSSVSYTTYSEGVAFVPVASIWQPPRLG